MPHLGKTLTLEKEFVALSKQVSFYENAAKRALA
jgi:hypothetical protein